VVPLSTELFKAGSYSIGLAAGRVNDPLSRDENQRFESLFTFEVREVFDTSLKSYYSHRQGTIAFRQSFRRLNGFSRQTERHLFRPSWEDKIARAGLHIALPIVGPLPNMDFTRVITKVPMTVPRSTRSSVRRIERLAYREMKAEREHILKAARDYMPWRPWFGDRMKTLVRGSIGDHLYDRVKGIAKKGPLV
jgi:hypothetical protein